MLLFDGKFEGRFKFDWTPIARLNGDFPSWRPWGDSAQTRQRGYDLNLDRFNWVNCDVFSGDSTNLTNKFCVALPDSFTNQNTNAFVVFKDVNSVVALASDARVKQFCVPSTYRGLPIGRQVIIVTVSNIRDRIYIATKEATIIANTVLRMEPTVTTKEALKTLIKNL